MKGKIVKGIAGFYYCSAVTGETYVCKAKGIFRNEKTTPLVGDNVELEVLDEVKGEGNIVKVLPRSNELIRPSVANIDQALVIFAAAKPEPNLNLLDRFLVTMQLQNIETIVCFNKSDIVSESELTKLKDIYSLCGNRVISASVREKEGLEIIFDLLKGKTTVLAGPSGVGKSSLMNEFCKEARMEVGALSEKIERGKQTTRHTELVRIASDTYLVDTPGFSSLFVTDIEKEELKQYFPEFLRYSEGCRFMGCNHLKEPDCAVKAALSEGIISKVRYENYRLLYEELSSKRKY